MLEKGFVPEGQVAIYRTMSSPDWWKKSVVPIFNVTKADIRDLPLDMKEGSNNILFLNINGVASSKAAAIQNVRDISQFIHQGGAYLAIVEMLRVQKLELINSEADIDAKINSAILELEYLHARLKNIEALSKRFPSDNRSYTQLLDSTDSSAKYLPISMQIIAINIDINNSAEVLERLRDARLQSGAMKDWLAEAEPIVIRSFNGELINNNLLDLEKKKRAAVGQANPRSLIFLDLVRKKLVANETFLKFGLKELSINSIQKRGMIKSTTVGLASAFFVILLALVGQRVWRNAKGSGAN